MYLFPRQGNITQQLWVMCVVYKLRVCVPTKGQTSQQQRSLRFFGLGHNVLYDSASNVLLLLQADKEIAAALKEFSHPCGYAKPNKKFYKPLKKPQTFTNKQ